MISVYDEYEESVKAYGLHINPEPWAMGDIAIVGRNKKFPKVSPNRTLKAYQEAVRAELEALGAEVVPGAYALRFTFSRQLVSYKVRTGKTSTRNAADVTNMQKATEDALQGAAIGNDRDVIAVASRMIGPQDEKAFPFVVIEIVHSMEKFEFDPFMHMPVWTNKGKAEYDKILQEIFNPKDITENEWTP